MHDRKLPSGGQQKRPMWGNLLFVQSLHKTETPVRRPHDQENEKSKVYGTGPEAIRH
jgi:hypothetical protein